MKKLSILILSILLVFGVLTSEASASIMDLPLTDDGLFRYSVDENGSITLARYMGTVENGENVITPDEIDGKPVTALGYKCFYDRPWIKTLVISEGIEIIAQNSIPVSGRENDPVSGYPIPFNLKLYLPSTLKVIEEGAFEGVRIKEIVLPDGVEKIGNKAFAFCNVGKIYIPSSAIEIGEKITYKDQATSDFPSGVTIYVDADSYAEQYVIENKISYKVERLEMPSPADEGISTEIENDPLVVFADYVGTEPRYEAIDLNQLPSAGEELNFNTIWLFISAGALLIIIVFLVLVFIKEKLK